MDAWKLNRATAPCTNPIRRLIFDQRLVPLQILYRWTRNVPQRTLDVRIIFGIEGFSKDETQMSLFHMSQTVTTAAQILRKVSRIRLFLNSACWAPGERFYTCNLLMILLPMISFITEMRMVYWQSIFHSADGLFVFEEA
ncbi:unnamed protein product [Soboliphyme baturini]|uniref:Uncharacterized protein n=1 Tax=Soboliphyme baturini TaxID=241478 RepID=A0A183INM7_9BILA|nr:unnamed protein product [Soboliphyme baturini]